MKKSKITLLTIAITTLCCISFANASSSPFAQNNANISTVKAVDKKCGEGKCGDVKKEKAEEKSQKVTENKIVEDKDNIKSKANSNQEEEKEEQSEEETESKCGSS